MSVVLPYCDDRHTITLAVQSVVDQTYRPLEVLLCDNGSADGSRTLALAILENRPGITVQDIRVEAKGAARARNAGLTAASGDYIAFLDSDDFWLPSKIERCAAILDSGIPLVAHAEEWRSSDGSVRVVRYSRMVDSRIPFAVSVYRLNPFSTSSVMCTREIVRAAGPFDEDLPSAEDYDYWLRLALLPGFHAHFVDEVLGVYTLRPGSDSSRLEPRYRAMREIGRRYAGPIGVLVRFPQLERVRFVARVRVAMGVRYYKAGARLKGLGLALLGMMQYPFLSELIRYRRAGES